MINSQEIEIKLTGIPSSNGIAIGNLYILKKNNIIISTRKIKNEEIEKEKDKFYKAIAKVKSKTSKLIAEVQGKSSQAAKTLPISSILENEILVITDEVFHKYVIDSIDKLHTLEYSIVKYLDTQKQIFLSSKDEIMRERAIDFDHIKTHLISIIQKERINYKLPEKSIILSKSFTPNEIVTLNNKNAIGLITEIGGLTSHSSILARSFEIPEVIGLKNATNYCSQGCKIIVDGFTGGVIINPKPQTIKKYKRLLNQYEVHKNKLGELLNLPCTTKDDYEIKLKANIDFLDDINKAELNGAKGIGLVRSESLLINKNSIPNEETQFAWYKEIATRTYPEEATIRVFDFGSDKFSVGLPKNELNPAMGLRGIRFLLQRKRIFKSQIKAILRASKNKNLRIMLPMISNFDELVASKQLIQECMQELDNQSVSYDKRIKIGIMIETPSSVIMAEELGRYCDFFSIGTNDLTQYTLAADRTNEFVIDIYDSFNPAILKMIEMTVKAAKKNKIEVGVCGELAGHSLAIPLLIGLGIKELSVAASVLPEVKRVVRESNSKSCRSVAKKALLCKNSAELMTFLG
jgi:phosphotransferase system enzyme I (PtsI)